MADPNDRKTADHYRKLDFDASWRGDDRVLCTYGYFYWGWALTCNSHLRGLAARAVARGREARPRHPRKETCDVGAPAAPTTARRGANVFNPKWVAVLEAQLDALPRDARVFIAADHESAHTKVKLVDVVRSRGGALLGTDKATANRDSDGGIYDALAENYALSSCGELLPRGTGASTFRRWPWPARPSSRWNDSDGGVRRAAQGPPRGRSSARRSARTSSRRRTEYSVLYAVVDEGEQAGERERQFHVTFSKTVKNACVFSGQPYHCAVQAFQGEDQVVATPESSVPYCEGCAAGMTLAYDHCKNHPQHVDVGRLPDYPKRACGQNPISPHPPPAAST
ncbi:hypothetical protein JL722_14882 [Aureococcus anophagefferens]|nr:hypothetical protein JL722_14882 [Aureococcus anophagefferens]